MPQKPDLSDGNVIYAADINDRYEEIYVRADETDLAGNDVVNAGQITFDTGKGITPNAWTDVTLAGGFSHGTPHLKQRLTPDGEVRLCGVIVGPFTGASPTVATLANAAINNHLIHAAADGGPPAFLIVVSGTLQFYPTSILPNGTYTLRVNGAYPIDL